MFAKRIIKIKENELTINGLLYSGNEESAGYAVVALHGFAGHKDSYAIELMAEKLIEREQGSVLISFDLPGHDTDREKLSLEMCDKYIAAVLNFLRRTCPKPKYVLYGTSFGGYLAIKYALEHPGQFDRYVLHCPALDMYGTMMNRILTEEMKEKLENGETVSVGFDRLVGIDTGFVDSLKTHSILEKEFSREADKTLIIQGTADELLDVPTAGEYAGKNGIKLILSEGADHRFLGGNTLKKTVDDCVDFICG